MVFDVVTGNPPYQDPSEKVRSDPLWSKFTLLGFDLVKDKGCLSLITPPMWMSGADEQSPEKKKRLVNIFFKNRLIYLRTDAHKLFPGVGTIAAAYVLQKGKAPTKTTSLITNESSSVIDVSQLEMLPLNITPELISIFRKVFHANIPLCNFVSQGCVATKDINYKTKTGTFKIYNTRQSFVYTDIQPGNILVKKLVISLPGNLVPFYEPGEYGLSVNCRWKEVQSEQEAEYYIQALNSPLFKLLFSTYRYNGFNNTWMIKHFPTICPFQKIEELYGQFHLSSKEIIFIEGNYK